jgi:hypothetical protein
VCVVSIDDCTESGVSWAGLLLTAIQVLHSAAIDEMMCIVLSTERSPPTPCITSRAFLNAPCTCKLRQLQCHCVVHKSRQSTVSASQPRVLLQRSGLVICPQSAFQWWFSKGVWVLAGRVSKLLCMYKCQGYAPDAAVATLGCACWRRAGMPNMRRHTVAPVYPCVCY